jgi:hypothetical protein
MESQLIEIKGKFLKVEMRMYDSRKKVEVPVVGAVYHMSIFGKARVLLTRKNCRGCLKPICVPIEEKDFNERLKGVECISLG